MRRTGHPSDPLWHKDAIIYELPVKSFCDGNGDGIGDFQGLHERLDYLHRLGVTCIWLLPFFPSPLKDDGYDIADYVNVHPSYGTLEDFRAFLKAAHERGMRVVIELVLNHTSDQHPWFQRARSAPPGSPERDYYVWSDTNQRYQRARIIFVDAEPSNWTWDAVAQAYYWHRFFHHQPDLNYDNPAVIREMLTVLDFWLDLGVDGFRLDAVPYLVERDGTSCDNLSETHAVIKAIRAHIDERAPDRMLLAEANQLPGTCAPTSAKATNVTWRITSRSCRASSWRCTSKIGTDRRGHGEHADPFPTAASGRFFSEITTSSRSKWSLTTSGTTCIWRTAWTRRRG